MTFVISFLVDYSIFSSFMPSSGSEVLNGFAELFDKPLLNVRPFLCLNRSGQYIFHAISENPNLSIGDCPVKTISMCTVSEHRCQIPHDDILPTS